MIHYVVDLSVRPINIDGFQTATFTEEQNTLCNRTIKVKSRSEFATKVQGIGLVDCPDCIRVYKAWQGRPFDCENCHRELNTHDIQALTRYDEERLCVQCKYIKY